MDTSTHKAAIIAYFNAHQTVTAAITEAFEAGNWNGINDGLATLNADSDVHKARAASLRTLVMRVTDGKYSVRVHKAGSDKVFMIQLAGATKAKRADVAATVKRFNAIIEEMRKLQRIEGFEHFHEDACERFATLDTLPDYESDSTVTAIRPAEQLAA